MADQPGPTRDKWGSKLDFILSCLGYAVGLGNVWRFPYLCGRSGGAAFMIPYLIMMVFAGLPVFYMELAIGQYAALTPALLYERMCPIFTGIGVAMIIISAYTMIYYNMIIAWSLRYLWSSFTSHLPWEDCTKYWNTEHCFDFAQNKTCFESNTTYFKGACHASNETFDSMVADAFNVSKTTPAEEYLYLRILQKSNGIHHMGYPLWELVVALAIAWFLIFLCLIKGIKSAGKVVYFTATFPYVILLILFFRGVTLPGAYDGVKFYMVPNTTKLMEGKVWGDAAVQIFFSLSLGGGGLTTLASYNQFHNNLLRDTLIVVFGNCLTSLFAGFVIFPILGFIAQKLDVTVGKVAKQGVGLAFIAYPDAITQIKVSPLWAILFFFMLVLLGIDSELVMCDVVITAFLDIFPSCRPWKRKILIVFGVCFAGFLIGLCLATPGGPYLLTLMDTFAAGWPLVMACLVEVVMVAWVYGIGRFIDDICLMLGINRGRKKWFELNHPYMNVYWWLNWVLITPLLLTFVLIFNWATYERTTYGEDYTYPEWADAIGWLMAFSSIVAIPIFAIFKLVQYRTQGKPLKALFRPTPDWQPGDEAVAAEMARKGKIATVNWKGNVHGSAATIGYPVPIEPGAPPMINNGYQMSPYEYDNYAMNASKPPSYNKAVVDQSPKAEHY